MNQDKIWDYFQNEGLKEEQFPLARQRFLASKIPPATKVLNIGVGSGALEKILSERGIEMYSLDPSARAIERLQKELNMGERAQAGYGQDMPFPDEAFDVVVMSELIEHLDDNTISAIAGEVHRVLRGGGMALVTTPFNERLSDSVTVCPNCGNVHHRVGHLQSFTIKKASEFFSDKGFSIERAYITTFVNWRRSGVINFVKSVARVLLARLGESLADPHIVFIARKPAKV